MAGIGHRGFMGRKKGGGGCSDSDGQAFITAAGITDPTQQAAICQLVKDLKGNGSTSNNSDIWPKFTAIFPMVGGTATKHSYNLINTSTYQITWLGAPYNNHTSDGVEGTGSSLGYGNVPMVMSDFIDSNGIGGIDSILSPDYTAATDQKSMGTTAGAGGQYYIRNSRTPTTSRYSWGNAINVNVTNSNSDGLHSIDCDGTNSKYYRNGVLLKTDTPTIFDSRSNSCFIMASFNSPGANYSIQTGVYGQWFAMRNGSLNATEMVDYWDAVNKFQTAIGR